MVPVFSHAGRFDANECYLEENVESCPFKHLCFETPEKMRRGSQGSSKGSASSSSIRNAEQEEIGDAKRLDPLQVLGANLMQEEVLRKLQPADIAACFAVCKRWKGCAVDDHLWEPCCRRMAGGVKMFAWRPSMPKYALYSVLMRCVQEEAQVRQTRWCYRGKARLNSFELAFGKKTRLVKQDFLCYHYHHD